MALLPLHTEIFAETLAAFLKMRVSQQITTRLDISKRHSERFLNRIHYQSINLEILHSLNPKLSHFHKKCFGKKSNVGLKATV
jgi:phosphopantetheinyl transferase